MLSNMLRNIGPPGVLCHGVQLSVRYLLTDVPIGVKVMTAQGHWPPLAHMSLSVFKLSTIQR